MGTSENYPGQNALVSYLREREKWSYRGFLVLHHDVIVASSFSNHNWKDLDRVWVFNYLKEAERLLDNNTFALIKEKVNTERLQHKKYLQTYWQGVIKECEKENLIPAVVTTVVSCSQKTVKIPAKDLSKAFQSGLHNKKIKKNIELINFCYDILHELKNTSYACLFYKHVEKKVPDKVIKHPMDLSTINLKLENDQYTSTEEFEKDIRLIFRNCYTYNNVGSEVYCSGEALESIFNKIWTEKLIFYQAKQKGELKRTRDDANMIESPELQKKQSRILKQNNKLVYKQAVNDALLVTSAYENLTAGNIVPFIKILKTFLLTRSRMSLFSADEPVLQAIIENFLPLKYRVPELSLVMDGKKSKGSGRFGYLDVFVLNETGENNISLELKYISLVGLMRNQKNKFGANELENLDKILEKEDEELLLKRSYTYWSKEHKKTNQTTIGEILNNGINQLKLYMNTISKGKPNDYSSSGVFDERVRITKSDQPNKLKGFVILVVGFHRILWKPVEDIISNYKYNKI